MDEGDCAGNQSFDQQPTNTERAREEQSKDDTQRDAKPANTAGEYYSKPNK